jgi:hypothetical protein
MKTRRYIAAFDPGGSAVRAAIAGHRCGRARQSARGSVIAPVNLPAWEIAVLAAVNRPEKRMTGA